MPCNHHVCKISESLCRAGDDSVSVERYLRITERHASALRLLYACLYPLSEAPGQPRYSEFVEEMNPYVRQWILVNDVLKFMRTALGVPEGELFLLLVLVDEGNTAKGYWGTDQQVCPSQAFLCIMTSFPVLRWSSYTEQDEALPCCHRPCHERSAQCLHNVFLSGKFSANDYIMQADTWLKQFLSEVIHNNDKRSETPSLVVPVTATTRWTAVSLEGICLAKAVNLPMRLLNVDQMLEVRGVVSQLKHNLTCQVPAIHAQKW